MQAQENRFFKTAVRGSLRQNDWAAEAHRSKRFVQGSAANARTPPKSAVS